MVDSVIYSSLLNGIQALDILGTYLTSSTVAPLNKEYIEIESPVWYVGLLFY